MVVTETRIYRSFEIFANVLLLNLVWLLCCLPLVTVFPATAAMFAVIRDWVRGEEPGVLRHYLSAFRELFTRSLRLECVWVPLGAFLAVDVLIVTAMPAPSQWLYVLLVPAAVCYALTSIYLFPVLVSFDAGRCEVREVLRNSLLFAITQLGTTAVCLVLLGVVVVAVVEFPLLLLAAGSSTAYLLFVLCHRAMRKAVASATQ